MTRKTTGFLVILVCLTTFCTLHGAYHADEEPADPDEKLVAAVGHKTDKVGLLDFFRKRSLTDEERKDCLALVKQLGSGVFEERKQASKDLAARGPVVIPLLREAMKSGDAEVVSRAKGCLEAIEAADPGIPLAAARLLVRRAPGEALPVLLKYLPYTASECETQSILSLILEIHLSKDDLKSVAAALADPRRPERAVSAFVLARKGTEADRDAVRKALADKDYLVRFRAAQGLIGVGDKEAGSALAALLQEAPAPIAGQAEEVLNMLAGLSAPTERLGSAPSAEQRQLCRAAWDEWLKNGEAKVAWKAYGYLAAEKTFGLLMCVEYNTGRVWECGLDKAARWEIKGLEGPIEARRLTDDLVLIAESGNNSVSVRDQEGKVRWTKKLDGVVRGCQPLPNGHILVFTWDVPEKPLPEGEKPPLTYFRSHAWELDAKGEDVACVELSAFSQATRKLSNGHFVYAYQSQIEELDAKGKDAHSSPRMPIAKIVDLQELPGERYLIASLKDGLVAEVNLRGKILWKAELPGACCVSRLPNGHTLVGANKRVVELDDKGNVVWEMKTEGYVRRVHGW